MRVNWFLLTITVEFALFAAGFWLPRPLMLWPLGAMVAVSCAYIVGAMIAAHRRDRIQERD